MVRTPPGIAAAARLCKQILVPSALAARRRPAHSPLMLTLHPRRLLDAAIGSHVQNGANAAEMGLAGAAGVLPPQYVNFKETTRSEMLEIKAKMGELRKLHGQVGLCVFQGAPAACRSRIQARGCSTANGTQLLRPISHHTEAHRRRPAAAATE